jgi:hypothetical protein
MSKDDSLVVLALVGSICLLIGLFTIFPFALIWSIATLAGTQPVYTFWTWLAAFIVLTLVRVRVSGKCKS